jgi:hypothetical protein
MGQKCEGNCGLWVLNEIIKNIYPENLKKIVGVIWELPAKGQIISKAIFVFLTSPKK